MKVRINGIEYNFDKKITILNAAREVGIDIPTLCYDDRLSPYGSCRLCLVKIDGKRITTSCNNYIEEGMEIITQDDELEKLRKENLKLIASKYPKSYKDKYPNKRFHELLTKYNLDGMVENENYSLYDKTHPYIFVNMNRCVNCYNCVRVCEDVIGKLVWRAINRGYDTIITAEGDKLGNSSCISCRSCIDVCPSGAIEDFTIIKYGYPEKFVGSSCTLCSITCPVKIGISNNNPVSVVGDISKLNNSGECIIGKYQWENIYYSNDRFYVPLLKAENGWKKVDYDYALNYLTEKIRETLNRYGPEGIGFIIANRLSIEEYYLLNILAKELIKTKNIFPIVSLNYGKSLYEVYNVFKEDHINLNDIRKIKTILVIGDIDRHHPALASMIRDNSLKGRSSLISIDDINEYRSMHEVSDFYIKLKDNKEITDLMKAIQLEIVNKEYVDKTYLKIYVNNVDEFLSKVKSTNVNDNIKKDASKILEIINKTPISLFYEIDDNIDEVLNAFILLKSIYKNVNLIPLIPYGDVFESLFLVEDLQNKIEDISKEEDLTEFIGKNIKTLIILGNNLLASSNNREKLLKSLNKIDFIASITPIIDTASKYYSKLMIPSATFLEKNGHYISIDFKIREVNKAIDNKVNSELDIINDLIAKLGGKKLSYDDLWRASTKLLSFI